MEKFDLHIWQISLVFATIGLALLRNHRGEPLRTSVTTCALLLGVTGYVVAFGLTGLLASLLSLFVCGLAAIWLVRIGRFTFADFRFITAIAAALGVVYLPWFLAVILCSELLFSLLNRRHTALLSRFPSHSLMSVSVATVVALIL